MKPTPEQLRLCADIIERNLDWEYSTMNGWTSQPLDANPVNYINGGFEIRVKPESKWIPLTADDVPPGSVFRFNRNDEWKADALGEWSSVVNVSESRGIGLVVEDGGGEIVFISWGRAMDREILRPGTTEWLPCRKERK